MDSILTEVHIFGETFTQAEVMHEVILALIVSIALYFIYKLFKLSTLAIFIATKFLGNRGLNLRIEQIEDEKNFILGLKTDSDEKINFFIKSILEQLFMLWLFSFLVYSLGFSDISIDAQKWIRSAIACSFVWFFRCIGLNLTFEKLINFDKYLIKSDAKLVKLRKALLSS